MDRIYTKEEILSQVSWLRSCIERGDYGEAVKVSARVSRACRDSKPYYDYGLTEREFLNILQNLDIVDYGVGGYLAPVTW